jgi:uncharacterized membrane protein YcaP (DUF421 family)
MKGVPFMFEFWTGAENLSIGGFLIRGFIVYLYIFLTLKILGQRSLGAINPLDFLFGVLIGDILGEPLSTGDLPLAGPLAAASLVSLLHLSLSLISLRTPRLRRILEDEPLILIEKGKILNRELRRTKVTVESLLMDLRLNNASDITEVDYAILESNGRISVIKKSKYQNVQYQDLNLPDVSTKGYSSVLVMDGEIVHKNLKKYGTVQWLKKQINKRGFKEINEIFLLTMDERGEIYTSRKM